MRRLFALALLAALVGTAYGQSIAIRQPLEGAKVRETVDVRLPARGIPANGYIGIFINGKFVEAVSPEIVGSDFVYKLNTRKLKLSDGPATIEAVLYLDLGEGRPAQVLGRTSVNVTVDNSSSIAVPEQGFSLNYRFKSGSEFSYAFASDTSLATISQAQALLGSRGFEVPREHDSFRFLYAVDNSFRDGSGLIRFQPLPDKGRSYAFVRLSSDGNQVRKITQDQMTPVWLKITPKGREVFGAMPPYFGIDGVAGSRNNIDVFLRLPLPVLPTKKVKPGDVWQGAFSLPTKFDGDLAAGGHVTDLVPARGTFEAIEYKDGVPCARIRTSIQSGAADLKNLNNLGFNQGQNQSLKLDSLVWLSLNGGIIIQQDIDLIQEALVDNGPIAAGGGGPNGGAAGGRRPGSGGGAEAGGATGASTDIIRPVLDPRVDAKGNFSMYSFQNGGLPPSGPGGQNGPPPGYNGQGGRGLAPGLGQGGGQGNGGGQQAPQARGKQIVRVSLHATFTLER